MIEREKKLEAAAKRTIPWLVLLGNHIGNGVPGDENGRCDALAALSEALGSADDVPRAIPGKKIVLTFDDVPGMRALLRHLAEHAFAIEDLLDSAACQAFDAEVERAIDIDEPGALVAPVPLVAPSPKGGFAGLNWRQAKALAEDHVEQFQKKIDAHREGFRGIRPEECKRYLEIWRGILLLATPERWDSASLAANEKDEIRDAISSGDYDGLINSRRS